ncbi:MAG: PTS transporter subunit EIIC [Erysipelotrichaceae bacterium]|nr:PTS transporter subunit EIIC [Erysipelotrichaceae bacterium]
MSNTQLANDIISLVGGVENISSMTHCVTRLRFALKSNDKADVEQIKKLDGVISVLNSGGQIQVVLGPAVTDVYNEAVKVVGDTSISQGEVAADAPKGVGGYLKAALDTLIACFVPSISIIAGAGMIKVLAVLLSSLGVISTDSATYTLLNGVIGDGVFYFLPFLVAYNAAKKMGVDVMTSMALAAIILHPNYLGLGEAGTNVSFFGLPLKVMDYSAQAIPVIFGVLLLKYVDKFAEKVSPNLVKVFLRPMISLLIVAPIMLMVIGPATAILSDLFLKFCELCNNWGWLAVGINAAIFPIMVLTGTHNATIPLLVQMFMTQGFDSVFLPSGMAANIAEAGAAGAVALKTRNKKLRGTALSATFSALLGITEPALYGVNLRLKKPFIAMLIGSAIGGCIMGLVKITAPTFVTPMLLTAPIFLGRCPNAIIGFLSIPLTYFITFAITYLFGFEDPKED